MSSPWQPDDVVEARYQAKKYALSQTMWYPGVVQRVAQNSLGLGDMRRRLERCLSRGAPGAPRAAAMQTSAHGRRQLAHGKEHEAAGQGVSESWHTPRFTRRGSPGSHAQRVEARIRRVLG